MQVTTELWKKLCEEAATEQDPQRLLELVKEINKLLEEKRYGVNGKEGNGISLNGGNGRSG